MAEDELPHADLAEAFRGLTRPGVPVVRAVLRPRPLEGVTASASPSSARPVRAGRGDRAPSRGPFGARVVPSRAASPTAARLTRELERLDADTLVVEIKAAAIDVVAEHADRTGRRLVLAGNDVVPLPGEDDLDRLVERLAVEAAERLAVGV